MFRRFTKLNMLNLMSLQAELMELETKFSYMWDALELIEPNTPFSVDFNRLRKAPDNTIRNEDSDEPRGLPELLNETLMEIRTKLKEYSKQQLRVNLFSSVALALRKSQMIHYFRSQRYPP